MGKKGAILNQAVVHIVLIALIFAIFLMATGDKINARGVKQQVLEKQIALLIDVAVPGMSFEVMKGNLNGRVNKLEVKEGKVFVAIEGLGSFGGYPYFSRYDVSVSEDDAKFVVSVR